MGERPEAYETPSPFEISSGESVRIEGYAQQLREFLASHEAQFRGEVDPSNASEQYRQLSAWNREEHDKLVKTLERPYVELAERVTERAVNHQHRLEGLCERVPLKKVPYAFASLPPNLFYHRGGEPFLPSRDEESIELVSEYMLFNRRLAMHRGGLGRDHGHAFMGSMASRGFDVVLDLRRRREANDQAFATEMGRQNWQRYSAALQEELRESPEATLIKNATYIAYRNNRLFSERGGFFEITDDSFESFWLSSFNSQSAFTSQIRVPVGWYGPQAAKELTLATYLMMELIEEDAQFEQDIKRIAHNPDARQLCQQHLLRSGDKTPEGVDPVEHGIKQTALEGVMSVSGTYGGIIEADGIPGHEANLWEGLSESLDQKIATQITARMPAGFIAAQTLFGDRLKEMMTSNGRRIRIRPEADAKLQVIRERRIAMHHAAWSAHKEVGADTPPPVRFGLYCPFKGEVVTKMAEALMVCRAIAHEGLSLG